MNPGLRRRRFLQMASALGLGAELAPWAGLRTITPLRAEDAQVKPEMVKFRPEIEPVVRLLEETPRDRALEVAITQLKKGLSYKDLLAGLFLAGIRNIKPRPVGFKFHAVMVINSAHVLGQSAAVNERLLPLLWALDNFKASQAQDVKEGDWVLEPVKESQLPKPHQAREEFVQAMEAWDSEAADAAVAALCRSSGAAADHGAPLANGRSRPSKHRTQGDLRRPELADVADDRLGTRRAGAPLAGLRHARPARRQPDTAGRALRGQPGKRRQDSPGLADRTPTTLPPPKRCSR